MTTAVLMQQQPPLFGEAEASENWDEDFEFQPDTPTVKLDNFRMPAASPSPRRRKHIIQRQTTFHSPSSSLAPRKISTSSAFSAEDWDAEQQGQGLPSAQAQVPLSPVLLRAENWDLEFEEDHPPRSSPPKRKNLNAVESWDDDEDDEEEEELGIVSDNDLEDRTVTARTTRRTRLPYDTPPPPPLPIPSLLSSPYQIPDGGSRSPTSTSSVFSLPNTITSNHTYASTTPLFPSSHPNTSHYSDQPSRLNPNLLHKARPQLNSFSLLPPSSPPIHKERERRRLRKKSRPQPHGIFDMGSAASRQDIEEERKRYSSELEECDEESENSDPPPLPLSLLIDVGLPSPPPSDEPRPQSVPLTLSLLPPLPPPPQTPSKAGTSALLSRIGSVKNWRRSRKGSTAPLNIDEPNVEEHRTPRPQSSLSNLHNLPSSSSPSGSNWFFRSPSHTRSPDSHARPSSRSGGGGGVIGLSRNASTRTNRSAISSRKSSSLSRSQSRAAANMTNVDRDRDGYVPQSAVLRVAERQRLAMVTPSPGNEDDLRKIGKRKSFGLLQFRGRRASTPAPESEDSGNVKSKYMGLGFGQESGVDEKKENDEEEVESPRSRRKSFSRLLMKDDRHKSKENEPIVYPSRGFIGSVRRISLVGSRHKRTTSGSGVDLVDSTALPSSQLPTPSRFFRVGYARRGSTPAPMTMTTNNKLPAELDQPPKLPLHLPTSSQLSLTIPKKTRPISASASTSHLPVYPHVFNSNELSTMSSSSTTSRNQQQRSTSKGREEDRSNASKSRKEWQQEWLFANEDHSIPNEAATSLSSVDSLYGLPKPALLPPIELQPPSPPHTAGPNTNSGLGISRQSIDKTLPIPSSTSSNLNLAISPCTSASSSLFFTPSSSPAPSSPNKLSVKSASSPGKSQSASLGRATVGMAEGSAVSSSLNGGGAVGVNNVPRRSSLGDLKIPARISQAQVSLKRDLGMVREFAANVEQLKDLQSTYNALLTEVQSILDARSAAMLTVVVSPQPRANSPTFLGPSSSKLKSKGRSRSNTASSSIPPSPSSNPQIESPPTKSHDHYDAFADAYGSIRSKYRTSWECAELLIELGSGGGGGGGGSIEGGNEPDIISSARPSPPNTSSSMPIFQHIPDSSGGRDRAVMLVADELASSQKAVDLPLSPSDHPTTGEPIIPPSATSVVTMPKSTSVSRSGHDLSHRQLYLLREMLNNANAAATSAADESHLQAPHNDDEHASSPLKPNKEWRWGHPQSSTITLPSEMIDGEGGASDGRQRLYYEGRKRRSGIAGIREILRSLKKGHAAVDENPTRAASLPLPPPPPVSQSTTSLSTESSTGSKSFHRYPHPRLPSSQQNRQGQRRSKTSTGPASEMLLGSSNLEEASQPRSISPYPSSSFGASKPSPRRPSLASIFRLGSKNNNKLDVDDKGGTANTMETIVSGKQGLLLSRRSMETGTEEEESGSTGEEEEDWDRMDSASDLEAAARGLGIDGSATVRGARNNNLKGNLSPYLQRRDSSSYYTLKNNIPSNLRLGSKSRHSLVQKRSFTTSQSELLIRTAELAAQTTPPHDGPTPPRRSSYVPARTARLSNVEENVDGNVNASTSSSSNSKTKTNAARLSRTGSTRSSQPPPLSAASSSMIMMMMPPSTSTSTSTSSTKESSQQPSSIRRSTHAHTTTTLPFFPREGPPKVILAMTPENIKPLLENAREVHARLVCCVEEVRRLLLVVC